MSYTEEQLEATDIDELRKDYETIGKFLEKHLKEAEQNRKKPMDRKKMREQIQHHKSINKLTQNKIDVGAEILKRNK